MARTKGRVAEREVARMLAAWWAPAEPGCSFVRTPLSGGWSAPTVRAEYRAYADIMTTARTFPFAVEVKRREAWSEDRFLKGYASPVWGWWAQAVKQAREALLVPMLWFRHNRRDWWVLTPERWVVDLPHEAVPTVLAGWHARQLAGRVEVHPVCHRADGWLAKPPGLLGLAGGRWE